MTVSVHVPLFETIIAALLPLWALLDETSPTLSEIGNAKIWIFNERNRRSHSSSGTKRSEYCVKRLVRKECVRDWYRYSWLPFLGLILLRYMCTVASFWDGFTEIFSVDILKEVHQNTCQKSKNSRIWLICPFKNWSDMTRDRNLNISGCFWPVHLCSLNTLYFILHVLYKDI